MAQTTQETLVHWLQDAYAMEHAAIDILDKQSKRLDDHPGMQVRVREHLDESRTHADRVKNAIDQLGGDTSALKKGTAEMMGNMAALTNAAAKDEAVKNALADYAFEHFEIASYRALVAAADAAGEQDVKATCQDILREEEAMAQWVGEHLPEVTQSYLTVQLA